MKLTQSKYLFDTTVFLDFLHRRPVAQSILSQAIFGNFDVGYSIMTEAELWCGIKPPWTEKEHLVLLHPFKRYNLNVKIARRAGELLMPFLGVRGLQPPGLADALIASTAEYHNLTICTRNAKHFSMFPVPLEIYKA